MFLVANFLTPFWGKKFLSDKNTTCNFNYKVISQKNNKREKNGSIFLALLQPVHSKNCGIRMELFFKIPKKCDFIFKNTIFVLFCVH
jgi:hypothetical protein